MPPPYNVDPFYTPSLTLSDYPEPGYEVVDGTGTTQVTRWVITVSLPPNILSKRFKPISNDLPRTDDYSFVGYEYHLWDHGEGGNPGGFGNQIHPPTGAPIDEWTGEPVDLFKGEPMYYAALIASNGDIVFNRIELEPGRIYALAISNVYMDNRWAQRDHFEKAWKYNRGPMSNRIFFEYVPTLKMTTVFGASHSITGDTLRVKLSEIGYPNAVPPSTVPSSNDANGTNLTDPANIDGCGLVLAFLQRILIRQYNSLGFDTYKAISVNPDTMSSSLAQFKAKQKIEIKNGKWRYSQQFDVKIYKRPWDRTPTLSKYAYPLPI